MNHVSEKSRAILNRAGWTFVFVFLTAEAVAPTLSLLDVSTLRASALAGIAAAISAAKNAMLTPPEVKG